MSDGAMSRHEAATGLSPTVRGWLRDAECVGEDPELFFPLTEREADPQVERARAVCRRCGVLLACRAWAVEQGEDAGVWGATTATQRRAIRRATYEGRAAPSSATRRRATCSPP